MAGPFFIFCCNHRDVNHLQYALYTEGAVVSNSFQQTTPKRRAARLALLAILLIVVAPLISVSLQKTP